MSEPDAGHSQPIASRLHTIGLFVIIVAWACGGVIGLANIRANRGPTLVFYYLRAIVFDWLIVAYVTVGLRRRGKSLGELIGGKWKRVREIGRDVLVAFVFWIVALMCLGVLRLALHAKSGVYAIRFLAPQSRMESIVWILVSLTAGFCEETIFRGYLQQQLLAWSGIPALAILLSAAAFGGVHAYQGPKQAVLLGVFGAMFGVLAYRRHSLRPGIIAHAWNDALAGLLIRLILR